jgi:hypothetical protein
MLAVIDAAILRRCAFYGAIGIAMLTGCGKSQPLANS